MIHQVPEPNTPGGHLGLDIPYPHEISHQITLVKPPWNPMVHWNSRTSQWRTIHIWANYYISLTWIKAVWGWFPLLTIIYGEVVVRSLYFTQIYTYTCYHHHCFYYRQKHIICSPYYKSNNFQITWLQMIYHMYIYIYIFIYYDILCIVSMSWWERISKRMPDNTSE